MGDKATPKLWLAHSSECLELEAKDTRFVVGKCKHLSILVDDQLAECECKTCGVKLNAIAVLIRFAKEETMLERRRIEIAAAEEKLSKRISCKCQHCQKMTRIY